MAENAEVAVEQPAEQPKSIEERIASTLEPEAPVEPEQPAEPTAEPEAESEAVEAEEPEQPSEPLEEEVVEVENLHALADYLEVPVADLYNMKIPVTVADGTKEEITLGQYKDDYKTSTQYKRAQKELEDSKTAWEAEKQAKEQEVTQTLQQAQALIQVNEQQLMREMQNINWDKLREENPGEFSAKRQELYERQNAIGYAKQQAKDNFNKSIAEQKTKSFDKYQEDLQRELGLMVEAIPAWKDESVAEVEQPKLLSYLVNQGYSPAQINGEVKDGEVVSPGIIDHRFYSLAYKAKLYDEQVAKADLNKKKVLKIGKKVLRPGSKPSKNESKLDALAQSKQRLRKSGKMDDAAKAIRELL